MSFASTTEPMAEWLEAAWMARYLERRLDDDETAWFEAYVLDKPHLVEAIERDNDVRDAIDAAGLRTPAEHGAGVTAAASRDGATTRRGVPSALAAALVAGVAGLLLGRGWTGADVAVDPLVLHVETMRSAADVVRIDGGDPSSASTIVEIVLPAATRRVSARLGDLRIEREPGDARLLTLVVPTAQLRQAGTLELTLDVNGVEERRSVVLPVSARDVR